MGEKSRMDARQTTCELPQGRVPGQAKLICMQIGMMMSALFRTSKTETKPTTQKVHEQSEI
jgi:hypothetical protein